MNKFALSIVLASCAAGLLTSCDDENTGSSIVRGEVSIEVDSSFTVTGRSVRYADFDSRSASLLIGRLSAEDFGELEASFASRLMPANAISIPDTIPLDSVKGMRLRFRMKSTDFTGDSLAPQQLTVYKLTKQLPNDINNATNLDGYYDTSAPLGAVSYTVTALGTNNVNSANRSINIELSKDFARELVNRYRTDPSIFQWPDRFAQLFPGIVVKSTFGRGLVANISNTEFITYYNVPAKKTVVVDGVGVARDTLRTDSTSIFAITPEVLSANLMQMRPAQNIVQRITSGECILMSPGGYNVEVEFPAQAILNRYLSDNFNLGVINTLTYEIPAKSVENSYGITLPPYMLMIKTSKMKDFFLNNEIPEEDDTDAFWAAYDSSTGSYTFSSMRPYIIDLMQKGTVTPEDTQFTLVPVSITTEQAGSTYNPKTVVTGCEYYIAHPTICSLNIPASKVKFTYSRQVIK